MSIKKENRFKWIFTGIVTLLLAAVIVLCVMMFKMERRLVAISDSQAADIAQLTGQSTNSSRVAPKADPPAHTPAVTGKSGVLNDWFGNAFDPDSWDPFVEMQHMRANIDNMFSNSFGKFGLSQKYQNLVQEPEFSPKVDLADKGDKYVVTVDLPGVEKGKIDVNVNDQIMTISGSRNNTIAQKDSNGKVIREERVTGEFSRAVTLPEKVNSAKLKVEGKDGVFTITVPKLK